MLAPVTHILPLTTIRRERTLPAPGKVLVRKGQKVNATDVIAETNLVPEHLLLDITRGLGVKPAGVDALLQVETGQHIEQGDVLAGPVGLTKRVVRSPRNGRVILAGDGQVLLEVESPKYELKAGIPGMVIELFGDRGAVIETAGALIQGVWGNGGVDFGLMHVLAKSSEEVLLPDHLDVSLRGSLILSGHLQDPAVLTTAGELPLRGLILASLASAIVPLAARQPYPIMVLEGFGRLPFNPVTFKLLSTSDQREVAVNAEPWNPFTGVRPELVIPLPTSGELPLPQDTTLFQVGQSVRVLRAPYLRKTGTLSAILPEPALLPNSVRAQAGEVRLESGERVILPLANLEVLV